MNSQLKITDGQLVAYSHPELEQRLKELIELAKESGMTVYVIARDAMVSLEEETVRVFSAVGHQEAYDYWMELEGLS